jgi:hypothetical protein
MPYIDKPFSRLQLYDSGFSYQDYSMPDAGTYNAVLVLRSWGKCDTLHCYFETDDGKKLKLQVYHPTYCPRESCIPFNGSEVHAGDKFKVTVKLNGAGHTFWAAAGLI